MDSILVAADIGHKNAKMLGGVNSCTPSIFLSTLRRHSTSRITDEEPSILEFNDSLYDIGSKHGRYSVTEDKSTDDIFKLCLLNGLGSCISDEYSRVDLVTGIPVNYYIKYRDSLRETYEGSTFEFSVNGDKKVINIARVKIMPEAVGTILVSPELSRGSSLVVDIGGRTVDVAYFEDSELVKTDSYDLGTLTLFSTIASSVNSVYGTDYSTVAGETILTKSKVTIDNIDVNYDCTQYINEHVANIIDKIRLDYPWKTSKKKFIGGGSLLMAESIDRETGLGTTVTTNSLYSNVQAYYKIGCSINE